MEKACDSCEFKDLQGCQTPCCDCGDENDCWRAGVKEFGQCGTCKNESTSEEKFPCNACVEFDEYEEKEEEEHNCDNCKYAETYHNDEPCRSCTSSSDVDNWEAKEEEEVAAAAVPDCDTCKYKMLPSFEPPCKDCNSEGSEWIPEGEEIKKVPQDMEVINLNNGFSILIGYDKIRTFKDGEDFYTGLDDLLIKSLVEKILSLQGDK